MNLKALRELRFRHPFYFWRCDDCGAPHISRRSWKNCFFRQHNYVDGPEWDPTLNRASTLVCMTCGDVMNNTLYYLRPVNVPFLSFLGMTEVRNAQKAHKWITDDLVPLPPHDEMCGEGPCQYPQHDYGVNPSTGSRA